jgi:ADP-ribose pyrophosphatase
MAKDKKAGARRVDLVDQIEDYRWRRFKILRAILRHRRSDGCMSAPVERACFERGHAAAVLLYNKSTRDVTLVRQFRYPAYAGLDADARKGEGVERAWLLEIVAGTTEKGESAEDVVRRETVEETGYALGAALERVAEVYVSPGASSERVTIYIGEIDRRIPRAAGGGVADEGEDTEVVTLPLAQALAMIETGEIADAKTVIALQHLGRRTAPA